MSLSVGVVNIEYLDEPEPPIYDFLRELLLNPYCGTDDEDDYDDDSEFEADDWGGNGLWEYSKASLVKRAKNWSDERSLESDKQSKLLNWIEALPWRDEYIMLHLGV